MLRERGNRHLTCDFGNPDCEQLWMLTGWSKATGQGLNRCRHTGETSSSIKYNAFFYIHIHLDCGNLVFRLAEPQSIEGCELKLAGRAIPIPEEPQQQGKQSVWQIPIPAGMVAGTKSFDLSLTAPDFAVVGDPIRNLHLRQVEA